MQKLTEVRRCTGNLKVINEDMSVIKTAYERRNADGQLAIASHYDFLMNWMDE